MQTTGTLEAPLGATTATAVSGGFRAAFFDAMWRERFFIAFIGCAFLLVGVTYQDAAIARWIGFLFAGYAAIANDSIQTIGTFLASNKDQKWWVLWLFIGGLFLLTVGYSWVEFGGDVSHQRLASKGFEAAPTSFTYLQIAAPLFLLILTRMKMPVSTTILLLTGFAGSAASVSGMLTKSISGYAVAFASSIAIWLILSRAFARWFRGEAHPMWRVAQWVTTGVLWSVWLMQDAANIAVYLPRSLSVFEFAGFAGILFAGLGVLFFFRGDRIQEVVQEKSHVVDVRMATMIDLVYALILYYFKVVNKIPMSTTWVFIGLLAGRELAMAIRRTSGRGVKHALRLAGKDIASVTVGLAVSLGVAFAVNDSLRQAVFGE